MTTTRRIPLTCPHCATGLSMGASRLRPGAWLPCPHCCAPIHLESTDSAMATALAAAKTARRERRRHLAALQRDWRLAPPALPYRDEPDDGSADVDTLLAGLDSLLVRLDELLLRQG